MKVSQLFYRALFLIFVLAACTSKSSDNQVASGKGYYKPWESLEELFHDVQIAGVYPDSKTFVDCTPKKNPADILAAYRQLKENDDFDLGTFVKENFNDPINPPSGEFSIINMDTSLCVGCSDPEDKVIRMHLNYLWNHLTRQASDIKGATTLIPLPEQYVVPGGRFREIYYWDSYFTMIGLAESGRADLIGSMIDNFAYLIDTVGFVPNGNRTYYLGRSQPPFFSSMVNLYRQTTSIEEALKYLPAIRKEYDFWMDGADYLTSENPAKNSVVLLEDGTILNRYWDKLDFPRPESYREDFELAEELDESGKKLLYRNLRAGAASGWDYSTRWFKDKNDFKTIRTIEILPVDLNCLMYASEKILSEFYQADGQLEVAGEFEIKAASRKSKIQSLFWDQSKKAFTDYVWTEQQLSDHLTLAGAYPLYFNVADQDQANGQAAIIQNEFLHPGGLITTSIKSGQQWDSPNGWAPLQWIAIKGLDQYGQKELAADISIKWLAINKKVFDNTGRMMEKYNVTDTTLLAGGGEYPTQDGFGWTNGVLLGLLAENPTY
ncbi:MAG: alpha,alpha-trehalase [Cyclobacteriaceae bacterium]|jgi:alpha,alpha-trehalase